MAVDRDVLKARWRAEERLDEVKAFVRQEAKRLHKRARRHHGGSLAPASYQDALEAAWAAAERRYPPPPMLRTANGTELPWPSLPQGGDLCAAAMWVADQLPFIVRNEPNKPVVILWESATSPPPGQNAIGMMEAAAKAPQVFQNSILPKYAARAKEVAAAEKHEDLAIEDLLKMIASI